MCERFTQLLLAQMLLMWMLHFSISIVRHSADGQFTKQTRCFCEIPPRKQARKTACGCCCSQTSDSIFFFFSLLDIHMWLSRFFQLSRPCHNKAELHKWKPFWHRRQCLCCVLQSDFDTFRDCGWETSSGNWQPGWYHLLRLQFVNKINTGKVCNNFHDSTRHVGVGANELNKAVLAKEVGESVCFFFSVEI